MFNWPTKCTLQFLLLTCCPSSNRPSMEDLGGIAVSGSDAPNFQSISSLYSMSISLEIFQKLNTMKKCLELKWLSSLIKIPVHVPFREKIFLSAVIIGHVLSFLIIYISCAWANVMTKLNDS